jgi:hypothetical protein
MESGSFRSQAQLTSREQRLAKHQVEAWPAGTLVGFHLRLPDGSAWQPTGGFRQKRETALRQEPRRKRNVERFRKPV